MDRCGYLSSGPNRVMPFTNKVMRGALPHGTVERMTQRRHSQLYTRKEGEPRPMRIHNTCHAVPPRNGGLKPGEVESRTVIVWFKNDLRLDDHPGLVQAATSAQTVIPFYCLDPKLAGHLCCIPGGVDLLWGALWCLRQGLRDVGSDLAIRVGDPETVVADFARSCGAGSIYTHDDIEENLASAIESVRTSVCDDDVGVELWCAPIWDGGSYKDNFVDFQRTRGRPLEPLPRVSELNCFPETVTPGELPSIEEMRAILQATGSNGKVNQTDEEFDPLARENCSLWSAFAKEITSSPDSAVQTMRAYLSGSPTTFDDGGSTLRQLIASTQEPKLGGVCFSAIFSCAMSLGLLSPRWVYREASARQTDTVLGLDILGNGVNRRHALQEVESSDFHSQAARLSYSSFSNGYSGDVDVRYWRWRSGHLMEYVVAEPEECDEDTPNVLLVHGFGASSYHWRRNVGPLRDAGYRVFCPTMPGYGRSEKPTMKYTPRVWSEYVKDFIVQVVKKPVVIGGNSIGGYMSARVAANHKSLVKAVILFNSAGPVNPDYKPEQEEGKTQREAPPKLVVDLFSNGLLWYLQTSAGWTLKSLYPSNPENADEALEYDLLRAGSDPNAVSVLKSVFFLGTPRPLNYLISELYGGPVLVLQGVLDPLNDAMSRAQKLSSSCPNVQVEFLQAGHCPHDEVPDQVNDKMLDFLRKIGVEPQRVATKSDTMVEATV